MKVFKTHAQYSDVLDQDMRKIPDAWYHGVILLICCIPIGLGLVFVRKYGVNLLVWDDWSIIAKVEQFSAGTFRLADLFAQYEYAEHRIAFPQLLILLTSPLTKLNSLTFMYWTQGIYFVLLSLIYRETSRQFQFNLTTIPIWWIPIPFLVFSWRQFEIMLASTPLPTFLPLPLGICAFYALEQCSRFVHTAYPKHAVVSFMIAILAATMASYSLTMGLLAWIVGLLHLGLKLRNTICKYRYLATWGIIGLSQWIHYSIGYHPSYYHPSPFQVLAHPLRFIIYYVTLLGAFAYKPQIACMIGACLIIVLLIIFKQLVRYNTLSTQSFWLATICYCLITLFVIAIGRSGIGMEHALTSRYTPYSLIVIIGVYVLLQHLIQQQHTMRRANGATSREAQGDATLKAASPLWHEFFPFTRTVLASLLLGGFMLMGSYTSYRQGLTEGRNWKNARESMIFSALTYQTAPDEDLRINWFSADTVRQVSAFLQRREYNIFNPAFIRKFYPQYTSLVTPLASLTPNPAQTDFAITSINGMRIENSTQPIPVQVVTNHLRIDGWAVDRVAHAASGGVLLDIDGVLYPARHLLETQGVAERYNIQTYYHAGFRAMIPVSKIGEGKHLLSLKILSHDQKTYYAPQPPIVFTLRKGQWSELAAVSSGIDFHLDTMNDLWIDQQVQPILVTNRMLIGISGWAIDRAAQQISGGVWLDIDGMRYPTCLYFERQDVANTYNSQNYHYAGFYALIPLTEIEAGEHLLSLKILSNDQRAYYAPAQTLRFITLKR